MQTLPFRPDNKPYSSHKLACNNQTGYLTPWRWYQRWLWMCLKWKAYTIVSDGCMLHAETNVPQWSAWQMIKKKKTHQKTQPTVQKSSFCALSSPKATSTSRHKFLKPQRKQQPTPKGRQTWREINQKWGDKKKAREAIRCGSGATINSLALCSSWHKS